MCRRKIMHLIERFETADKINFVGIIVALTFSVINLCSNSAQNKRLAALDYQSNAVNFQPKLVISKEPIEYKLFIDSTLVKFSMRDFFIRNSTEDYPIFNADANIQGYVKFKITNTGNSIAKLQFVIQSDTTDAIEYLRRHFFDKSFSKKVKVSQFSSFTQSELLPNAVDTLQLKFDVNIKYITDNSFTLHFLIFYENELGNYYDTYYWVQFNVKDILFPRPFDQINGKIIPKPINFKIAFKDIINYSKQKVSYTIYTKQEDVENINTKLFEINQLLQKKQ